MTPKIAGALILGMPLIVAAWALLWRGNRPVFWFALALIMVSLGYLMTTGAADDIARRIVPQLAGPAPVPVKAK